MSLRLDDIKYFQVIANTLNLTRASEILGLTQPTLSYGLKRLESELGKQLVVRQKNGLALTKVGEEFSKKSYELVSKWEEAQKIMDLESQQVKGEYTIALHASVALYTLDKFLPKVYEKFPGLDFKLIHGPSKKMAAEVINWKADFGIVINPTAHPDLVIRQWGKDVVTLFKAPKALNRLICDPSLIQSMYILNKLKKAGLVYNSYLHTHSLEVITKLTAQGLGTGLLPARALGGISHLKEVPKAPKFHDRVCFIYRKERHQNPVSKKILEFARNISV